MISSSPSFKFALSPDEPALTPQSELWSLGLPMSRHAFNTPHPAVDADADVTYGDYFTAVQSFLSKDRQAILRNALAQVTCLSPPPARIDGVSVYLIKHGAFYHPAYVVVDAGDRQWPFVLNAAVSHHGRSTITQEHQCLSRLNDELAQPFWPRVFTIGHGHDLKRRPIPMFLGQWLEGYHEFHLSREDPGGPQLVVWDPCLGHCALTRPQTHTCLEQAAGILAYAYNPVTFEAIRHWHHGAGDFILARRAGKISMRLITVRRYAPIIENTEPDAGSILEALLVFWLETTMRLRLDRLDGIGRVVCHDDDVVPAVCCGFFKGLHTGVAERGLPRDFSDTVADFFALHSPEQLRSTAAVVIEKAGFIPEEQELLKGMLDRHASALTSAVKNSQKPGSATT